MQLYKYYYSHFYVNFLILNFKFYVRNREELAAA